MPSSVAPPGPAPGPGLSDPAVAPATTRRTPYKLLALQHPNISTQLTPKNKKNTQSFLCHMAYARKRWRFTRRWFRWRDRRSSEKATKSDAHSGESTVVRAASHPTESRRSLLRVFLVSLPAFAFQLKRPLRIDRSTGPCSAWHLPVEQRGEPLGCACHSAHSAGAKV